MIDVNIEHNDSARTDMDHRMISFDIQSQIQHIHFYVVRSKKQQCAAQNPINSPSYYIIGQ